MQRTVLVVEDDANLAQLVQMHVEDLGCDTVIAADGGSAIAAWDAGGIGDRCIIDRLGVRRAHVGVEQRRIDGARVWRALGDRP